MHTFKLCGKKGSCIYFYFAALNCTPAKAGKGVGGRNAGKAEGGGGRWGCCNVEWLERVAYASSSMWSYEPKFLFHAKNNKHEMQRGDALQCGAVRCDEVVVAVVSHSFYVWMKLLGCECEYECVFAQLSTHSNLGQINSQCPIRSMLYSDRLRLLC